MKRALKWPTETGDQRKEQGYEIRHAIESQNHHKIVAALKSAQTEPGIEDTDEDWDSDPWQFGVANGIVELKAGKFRQLTPAAKVTKFSQVAFEPAALQGGYNF